MNEKQLNEKESLELIAEMIRNTQQRLVKNSGLPFLTWGYTTIIISVLVWYMVTSTNNHAWNWLWFLVPAIGYPLMLLTLRKKEKVATTYIDRAVGYVWLVFGVSSFLIVAAQVLYAKFPILFTMGLLMGMGTAITGLIIKFKPLTFAGFAGMVLSFLCLVVSYPTVILVFALLFLVMMVIPGHILNYKSRKSDV